MYSVISLLEGNYKIKRILNKEGVVVFHIESGVDELACPYCGKKTSRIHSYHTREI